jgi:hypothetical protein
MANDNLYVVKRTFFNPRDPAEQSFHVTVPATCTDLNVAKKEAKMALTREGYETDFFSVYDVNNDRDRWKHGDGVVVYAEGWGGAHSRNRHDTEHPRTASWALRTG